MVISWLMMTHLHSSSSLQVLPMQPMSTHSWRWLKCCVLCAASHHRPPPPIHAKIVHESSQKIPIRCLPGFIFSTRSHPLQIEERQQVVKYASSAFHLHLPLLSALRHWHQWQWPHPGYVKNCLTRFPNAWSQSPGLKTPRRPTIKYACDPACTTPKTWSGTWHVPSQSTQQSPLCTTSMHLPLPILSPF